jgi:predicted esterase
VGDGAGARRLVVLHGFEDEPDGRLAPRELDAGWQVVEPRAELDQPGGPVWFRSDDHGPVETDVVATLDRLATLMADLTAESDGPVVLGGSSQGGAVALALALRSAPPLSGLFCVNGWLASFDAVAYEPEALAAHGTRVLVVGSTDDEVVPVQAGRSAARYLERAGLDVTWVELGGGHAIGPDAVAALADWLATFT